MLFYALSIGGGLFGLLLLWSWFVQKMTAGIPPAVVEISKIPLVSGASAKICVRQPGPATFKTLRANLICLRRKKKQLVAGATAGKTGHSKTWVDRQVYDQNLIDVYEVQPSTGDEWIDQADFYVPPDQPLSMMKKDLQIAWRIEVWGRVGFGIGVMHSFDVRVAAENEEPG
ncbi:MAG: hypothetical protein ABGZ17_04700 [Planctomycetaceae bacterium]